jgi:protein-disulfide isomerase
VSDVERIYTLAPSAHTPYTLAPSAHTPKLGPDTAKVKLEVCSDFQCPFCARLEPTLHELVENYGELIQIAWRNCPLPNHEYALPAAEAALEVQAQGGDKAFWAYHDQLFTHQTELTPDQLVNHAKTVPGIDGERVRAALTDHRHLPRVREDWDAIRDSGAIASGLGTPATFVNGRLLMGAQPYEEFETAVERALQESPEALKQAQAASDAAYPMVHLRHILIQYVGARGADEKITRTKEQAMAFASELHQKLITGGATLPDLAKQHSDCPSAEQGGDLGRLSRGELVPSIERVAFSLAPGEVSPVVESPFGFHVILREP